MFRAFRYRRRSRGQSLVEFALVVPILLLLVLGAIDFGRVFLGWVSLQNMARVGANFAALHADAWPGSATDRARYESLMLASGGDPNCPVVSPLPAPSFGLTKNPGDPVRVDLSCRFSVLTPLIGDIVGKSVTVSASSTFPITSGCLTNCGTTPGATLPPLTSNCRTVPQVIGLSVAGARLAWAAAGFTGNFSPSSPGPDDTLTVVAPVTITPPSDAEACPSGQAFFLSSLTVTPEVTAPAGPDCVIVPNLLGMTVGMAREDWSLAGFTGSFTPQAAMNESKIVVLETTSPVAQPGECIASTAAVTVSYVDAPTPPPAPCKVPSFIGTSSEAAELTWTTARFSGSLTFVHKRPYTIRSQTLVGGAYVACGSAIEVSPK